MKYLWLVLLVSAAYADTFKIAGEYVEFANRDGLLLKGCEQSCAALKAIEKHKKIDLKALRKEQKFANSTGSDVCALQYKARSVIGIMENRDQRAFCVFADQSMVEMNSLGAYLESKNIVKK